MDNSKALMLLNWKPVMGLQDDVKDYMKTLKKSQKKINTVSFAMAQS